MAKNKKPLGDPPTLRAASFLWSSDRKIDDVYRYKVNANLDMKPALTAESALQMSPLAQ
jgi:hypothetical protein